MVTPFRGSGGTSRAHEGPDPGFPARGESVRESRLHRPTSAGARGLTSVAFGPRALEGFGLSPREARLYLTLATRGPLSGRQATESSGLRRATVYRAISRLLARGLVRAETGWPRHYTPLPLRTLVERQVAFLRDEIELRYWQLSAFAEREPSFSVPPRPGHSGPSYLTALRDPELFAAEGIGLTVLGAGADSPLLEVLAAAQRGIDALVRPLQIPARLRPKIAAGLARAAARGYPVRVILDYQTADRRFAVGLRRELTSNASNLEVRQFTPLGGHLYVVDQHTVLRFPVLSSSIKDPDSGIIATDPGFVRNQQARFEAIWEGAVSPSAVILPGPVHRPGKLRESSGVVSFDGEGRILRPSVGKTFLR